LLSMRVGVTAAAFGTRDGRVLFGEATPKTGDGRRNGGKALAMLKLDGACRAEDISGVAFCSETQSLVAGSAGGSIIVYPYGSPHTQGTAPRMELN
jgi:hypothetical protein